MNKKNNKFQQGGFSPLYNFSNKKAFTIIEIMAWILISSMIILTWFIAFNSILIWKVKLIEATNIEKESFKFSQKFFEEIKAWWTIDYEEYFNRKVVSNTDYSWGHFSEPTWFWNFWKDWNISNISNYWNWFYYCRSSNLIQMTWSWCVNSLNTEWSSVLLQAQRYGQYSFQFIDYNANYDEDRMKSDNSILLWDEDWDWEIIWDDDDEYLGTWPDVFESWTGVTELYLISADKTKRTLFRWSVIEDPKKPSSSGCTSSNWWKTFTWSWCLWTIEFLKLEWKDWWDNHDKSWIWLYDWVVDTWLINKDFAWKDDYTIANSIIAWSDNENYRLPLFPNSINVKSFDIKAYPNKDVKKAWKEDWLDLAPYVRINMVLTPSWKVKAKIKWNVPEFNISTTINLTDIFSR